MGIKLHRNLSAAGINQGKVWSIIMHSGKVAGWCRAAEVYNGSFIFSASRYAAMQQRRTRWLVAWVRGGLVSVEGFIPSPKGLPAEIQAVQRAEGVVATGGTPVAYRFNVGQPFGEAAFRTAAGVRVDHADRVRLHADGSCTIGSDVATVPVARVARNLNAKASTGLWSLRALSGRVVGWCQAVELADGSFVRSESGFRQVVARGRRDVFAWVEGDVCLLVGFVPNPEAAGAREVALVASLMAHQGALPAAEPGRRVHFRPDLAVPFAANLFRLADGAVVESADRVRCLPDAGCYIA